VPGSQVVSGKGIFMKREGKRIRKMLLFLMILVLLLPAMPTLADGLAVIVEVCTNETDLSIYVKNAGDSLTDVTAQVGTSAVSEVSCQSIKDTEFETLILIDNSLSIPKDMRSRTSEFLEAFFSAKAPNEKIALGVFSRDITYLTGFTSDYDTLKEAAAAVSYQNQDTYITDMLYELLQDDYLGSKRDVYRRIIIIADGVDNESLGYTVDELKQLIKEDTYPIYTIGCKAGSNETELENLFALSRQSNAEYFLMDAKEDITAVVEALGKDQDIVKVTVTPMEELLDGSVKSVKINFPGESVSKEVRMPQQEMEVVVETSEPETVQEESSIVETEEQTQEETTSAVDEEALRRAAVKRLTMIVIAAWVVVILAVMIWIAVRRYKKKMNNERIDAQNLIEQRQRELQSALPDEVRHGEIYLVLTDAREPEKHFQAPLNSEIIVGRSGGQNRIILDYDPSISGSHCVIYEREHKVMIRDLDSTNGTFVNGERISGQTELKQGDTLALGQLEMKVGIIIC